MTTLADLLDRTTLDPATGCLVWQGARNPRGYGWTWHNGRTMHAHRLAFALARGLDLAALDGLDVRHTVCRNPSCVCPSHLRQGTRSDNVADAVADGTHPWAARTHCPEGHPYDEANTYRPPSGGRQCKACTVDRRRRARHAARGIR